MAIIQCATCGIDVEVPTRKWKYCPACRVEACKERQCRYTSSEKGKARFAARREQYRTDGRYQLWNEHAESRRDKDAKRQHDKEYRAAHREEYLQYQRAYREKYPERCRESKRKYCKNHPERKRESDLKWRAKQKAKLTLAEDVKMGKPGAKLNLARLEGKLTYCERMRVTMYPLPCGTRGECKGCVHCPEGAACGNDGHYR